MNNKIMETLDILEDKIENIKWLLTSRFYPKKTGLSETINIIRKSSGILGKEFPRGTTFENRIRREWKTSFLRRAR